jgi:2-keto-4-pentenoate hydratase/2-oxohepta-3-ene-1,7-dioic acid hydratase in catechol pathway
MSYQHQYVDGTRIHFPLGKVVCIGRNYAEHAKELDNPVPTEPLLFIKPGSCVVPLEGGFRSRPSVVRCTTRRKSPC